MLEKYFKNLRRIMVLGSSACNLHCDYCYLHEQHDGNAFALLNREIQKAWKDGTYVDNIINVCKKIGCIPSNIYEIGIWGGEPLISAQNLMESFHKLLYYFTKLESIHIPTNFVSIKYFEIFLKRLDDTILEVQPDIKKFTIHFQLSIDGPPGPILSEGHKGDWNLYRKNIISLCKLVKQLNLKKIELSVEIHPTTTKENILAYLSNYDSIIYYLSYYINFIKFINDSAKILGVNNIIRCSQGVAFTVMALPYDISIEESNLINNNIILLEYIKNHLNMKEEYGNKIYYHAAYPYSSGSVLATNPVCTESGIMGATIMYDGTICDCPCNYVQKFPPYIEQMKNNPLKKFERRIDIMRDNMFFNPLTATEQEIEDYEWYTLQGLRTNENVSIACTLNLAIEMALSRQITPNYAYDLELLFKHLSSASAMYSCPREQLPKTKSMYLPTVDECRRWLNGSTLICENERKTLAQFGIKGALKTWKIDELSKKTMN